MNLLVGAFGVAVLFVLMGFSASRKGSRLEADGDSQGDSCTLDSCGIAEECGGCEDDEKASGWWPDRT